MKLYIQKLSAREHLTREEARDAMRTIMDGAATEAQIAAFLVAMKLKGEMAEEIAGFVEVMREKSVKARIDDPDAIDMCGTGGDSSGTFNISTAASFVVAGGGVTVAKHGNRSISSSCGSADVLKALGVNIDISAERAAESINAVGIGFLFAPLFHPAMKYAAKPRAELGIKTCFNMLGPMTNPAGVRRQVIGAYSPAAAQLMCDVLHALGANRILLLHSSDGMDEVSLADHTMVYEIHSLNGTTNYRLDSTSFSLPIVDRMHIMGSLAEENAAILNRIFHGENGAPRDVVVANAALGFVVAGKASTVEEGVSLAQESLDSGAALAKLITLREFTNA